MPQGFQTAPSVQIIQAAFDDIDAMAASPLAWNQQYEQIGSGRFQGRLTQMVLNSVHLGRVVWSPGVLQCGVAPEGTWAFGLPVAAKGTLHVRRRPVQPGELLSATSQDDIGFAATGETDIMVTALPVPLIDRWMQARRGVERLDTRLPTPRLAVTATEIRARAMALARVLESMMARPNAPVPPTAISRVESRIFDVILDMIRSAEAIEPLHHRARIAREVLAIMKEHREYPLSITDLCIRTGAKERTLFLSCVEAFGKSPARLLVELRLNAARRALQEPDDGATVTRIAAAYGFTHFGRFSESYLRQFGELPSATLARAGSWRSPIRN
jgi:AraC family ethanolamine operon transcriptional activator